MSERTGLPTGYGISPETLATVVQAVDAYLAEYYDTSLIRPTQTVPSDDVSPAETAKAMSAMSDHRDIALAMLEGEARAAAERLQVEKWHEPKRHIVWRIERDGD